MKKAVYASLVFFLCQGSYGQHQHGRPEKLGTVSFLNSCSTQVQSSFNRAVAWLHSFEYLEAANAFAEVGRQDPNCAMAHWGAAMSYYHQLWVPPLPGDAVQKGQAEIELAQKIPSASAREKEFIAAASLIFSQDAGDYATRSAKYREAMALLAQHYPDDIESQIFYALALIATANPQDKSHQNQKKAVQVLQPLYARFPQHPGLAHYLIHADDNAELAQQGLAPARAYAQIAPSSPHALHMPSHIFTRLGMWKDAVRSNQEARMAARQHGDIGEELHAMDYLVYASLQSGHDADAAAILKDLEAMGTLPGADFKVSYAATAMPIRYAVERKQWADAIHCTAPAGAPPQVAALAAWARALGQARLGNAAAAGTELQSLQQMVEILHAAGNEYWSKQVHIQAEEAEAWISFAEHKPEAAAAVMEKAADEEDAVEKLPVTPGPVVPAREQVGDLLALTGHPEAALAAYEKSLQASPGRRGALRGAMDSARAAGVKSKSSYYEAALKKTD